MTTLAGKTALVTGSSRGIGRDIAQRLAKDGAQVIVHYTRGEVQARETVESIVAAGGSAFMVGGDLGSLKEIEAMFAAIDQQVSKIDILVNNAATLGMLTIDQVTEEIFDHVVTVNLKGTYFVTKLAIERLADNGRIINISSNCTRVAYPEVSVYGLTKAGLENLSLGLAQQLGPRGITVNNVVPGIIDTEMNASWLSGEVREQVHAITAMGRIGKPEEVAGVVAFLASGDASWVTAQTIEASGGCRI